MYIPITKTEEKCAGQLSYGFNIQDKLEGCTKGVWFFFFQGITSWTGTLTLKIGSEEKSTVEKKTVRRWKKKPCQKKTVKYKNRLQG